MSGEFAHRSSRIGGDHERVQLLFETESRGGSTNRELPFVIGVLADLSGNRTDRTTSRPGAVFDIDRDDFSERMERIGPKLHFNLPGLGEVNLSFRELDDFGPAQVAEQVPALKDLIHGRRRVGQFSGDVHDLDRLIADLTGRSPILKELAAQLDPPKQTEPAQPTTPPTSGAALLDQILGGMPAVEVSSSGGDTIDQLIRHAANSATSISRDVTTTIGRWQMAIDRHLSESVRSILHHPDFRALEGSWRGLWHLVRNSETNSMLKIRVFDVRRSDLATDLASPSSAIFERIAIKPFHEIGEPYGLLVTGFEFGPQDIGLLRQLALLGQAAHSPVIGSASAELLGISRFSDLPEVTELRDRTTGEAFADWRTFRESAESRYAVLTIPRVLARQPYGKAHSEVEEFSFEEMSSPSTTDGGWMSAAWCYGAVVAGAFSRDGWFNRMVGPEGGGKVPGLPAFPVEHDDETIFVGPTEKAIPGQEIDAYAQLGFATLMTVRRSDVAVFMSVRSCRKPSNDDDALLCDLRVLLASSRFASYLLLIGHLHPGATPDELSAILNDWLNRYKADPDSWNPLRQPLLDGMVKVKPVPGQRDVNRVVAALVLPLGDRATPTQALNVGTVPATR